MKHFQKIFFNLILWVAPLPAALGWNLTRLGDALLERSGGVAMSALKGLGKLESEGQ